MMQRYQFPDKNDALSDKIIMALPCAILWTGDKMRKGINWVTGYRLDYLVDLTIGAASWGMATAVLALEMIPYGLLLMGMHALGSLVEGLGGKRE